MLHQESLDKAPSGASASAQTLFQSLRQIRRSVLAARARWIRPYLPEKVKATAEELVKGVSVGKVSTQLLTGGKAGDAPVETIRGLMAVWPAFCALVEEVSPRDATATHALLMMAKEAFDSAAKNPAAALKMVMRDVFEELEKRSAQYLAGVEQTMPTWEAIREAVMSKSQRDFMLSGTFAAPAWKSPKADPQAVAAAAAAAAAAKAEAEAAAAADGGSGDKPSTPKKGKKDV
jgi:hypothetical protein